MNAALRCLFAACLVIATLPALAEDLITFDACTDMHGKAVPTISDTSQPELVLSRVEDGKPVIRYNPKALPQLLPETRRFLYAHECARHYLGLPLQGELTLAQAQRADCEAVATLVRSRLLASAADASGIERELMVSDDDWKLLPGPKRSFELTQCKATNTRGSLALPTEKTASDKWNACVQGCGARLYACGRTSSCQQAYDACSARCGQ